MEHEDSRAVAQLKELGVNLETLKSTEGWSAWLRLVGRLHAYSVHNTILIWAQRPEASMVMGYRAWQQVGRQVRKGEKGIKILAPMLVRDRDPEAEEGSKRLRFKVAHVFDVAQTDGAAIEDPIGDVWNRVAVPDDRLLEELVARVHERTDIQVQHATATTVGARGWYIHEERTITIVDNADTTPASQVRTLLHELGHAHDPRIGEADGDYQARRAEYEMIAEASAWLASRPLGVDMDEASATYLASWRVSDDQLLDAAARVITAWRGTSAVVMPGTVDTDERGAA